MAARQDQTQQIALIFFVGTTIVLLGFLVWVNNLRDTARQAEAQLQEERNNEQSRGRQLQNENEKYRTFMGFEQFEDFTEVEKQFQADVEAYMQTFPEADRNYRTLVTNLDAENNRSTEQESQAKQREKELNERLLAIGAQKDAQIKQAEETLSRVQADAASERAKLNASRDELEKEREELIAALDRQRTTHEKQVEELSAQIADLTSQRDKVAISRDKLLEARAQESPSFEVADGRISWVNQSNQTVWINLGERDSLRRQVTFSVFEQSDSDAGKAEKKASIEVTRLLGDHMAEARITEDSAQNPILPGDQIYSQVWHRGKAIHFALTGVLDLDGDGRADLQQAKDLIALNGGVIDASVTESGSVEGEITIETRYLVLGDFPSLPSQSALRASYDEMSRNAQIEGVETITLQEFLNQMGYRPLDRTVGLGRGARRGASSPEKSRFRPRSAYFGL